MLFGDHRFVRCFTFLILVASMLSASAADVRFPIGRTAYFAGELVPIAASEGEITRLEGVNADGTTLLFLGSAPSILLDTKLLAPGSYRLRLNGLYTEPAQHLHIVTTLRRSTGSMQDEAAPPNPQFPNKMLTPAERSEIATKHWEVIAAQIKETRLTGIFPTGQADVGTIDFLDAAARSGVLTLVNPDTRPTSFFPVGNDPAELDSMSQRVILAAQANGRYPNFGGFFYGWDTTGYGIGNRRGLLTYWGWGDKTEALRAYLGRIDKHTQDEFKRRTGMEAVTEAEYIAYLLSIKRPEFATLIDLPTRGWLNEIAQYTKPMAETERIAFEKRLDAWSAYLMGMYNEAYSTMSANLRTVDPSLRNTASVQVDHAPVRYGQYFPSAYKPLDFQYQSTWNDQVGGPDYAYQWLFTAGLLDMQRGDKPTWLSNAFGPAHHRADTPGKFTRVAAHGLAWGVSGIGFAFEGFSTILGSMNKDSTWPEIKGKVGEADVASGHEFLDRFACLATTGRGDHGVGILFSKSQYQRQHIAMGFGTSAYQSFVILTRLGYTPRFVTEEELVASSGKPGVKTLLVIGQTFPLPSDVNAAIDTFSKAGGRILIDGGTTVTVPGAEKLDYAFSFTRPGKPHNWAAPNMPAGDNDSFMMARWHAEIGPILAKALGESGRGLLKSEAGPAGKISLTQIDGGADAKYVVAVNDSFIKSQADWHQVTENLLPTAGENATPAWIYDCTDEKSLGKFGKIACDLNATTARVYAVFSREPAKVGLQATQELVVGGNLAMRVQLLDAAGQPLRALTPFCITLLRPDGKPYTELYRSTDRVGDFKLTLAIPSNAPAGKWKLSVRSQLDGRTSSLPINVATAPDNARPALAAAYNDAVLVRGQAAGEQALVSGAKFVLPIFDSPAADKLAGVAEKVKTVLATRGVQVEIRRTPAVGTYTLAYDLKPQQAEENAKVDRGELIGKIKRETLNHNDWYCALSGWRFPQPLILLDLAGEKGDAPPAETLGENGMLWPQVSAAFPGAGRAVVDVVPWAFAPRATTIVIRSQDVEGLMQGAAALSKLPADRLTPRIEATKAELWRQHHIGPAVAATAEGKLTATGLEASQQPQPFAIPFLGAKPPRADEVVIKPRATKPAKAVPAIFEPKEYVIFTRDGEDYLESATAEFLVPDLRFSDASQLTLDVPAAGKYRVTVQGVFRYSDRKPCWQAQWEDIIELREKLVPKQRRPASFEVRLDDRPAGTLLPTKTEMKEVPLELASSSAGLKPKTANEEVVTQFSGDIELPAGRHRLMVIHRNVVDGRLEKIEVGR